MKKFKLPKLIILFKTRKYPEGTIRIWSDGRRVKKVNGKWKQISYDNKYNNMFLNKADYLLSTALTTKVGYKIDSVLIKYGIKTFDDLVNKIRKGSFDTAHKLFKDIKDNIDKSNVDKGVKKVALDYTAKALLMLRSLYHGETKPKTKLTVKVRSKSGKEYYKKKSPFDNIIVSPKDMLKYKKRLGGWIDFKRLPSIAEVKKMLKNKNAKLIYGRLESKKPFILKDGLNDIVVPFRENDKGILIKLRQAKQVKKRTSRISEVEITIPFKLAPVFVKNQIKSVRTRNALLGYISRSKGFKKVMGNG